MVATSLLLACLASVASTVSSLSIVDRSAAATAFFNPVDGGGSWLNNAGGGGGEPLNVVISGLSSPDVLTDDGVLNFARSIGFSTECFGIHLGDPQSANLGDGHGFVNQTVELRQDFGNADVGTCLESLIGGNHFRVYRQNGPSANSGALFLAVSQEENVNEGHTISPDGYDVGRDALAAAATGKTSFGGVNYSTEVQRLENEMPAGANGVNHGIAVDGAVVLLTVTIE
ncbi:hypothetical protein BXZ70DRAFT_897777 [Cristinia sonorae]|uniref:Uncharacterized protein n=1 Tax=Cristinia sonorae TaxID=1940300 RepID=A0A8K0XMT0_9AGAR|nr:hypothetical protein BXZ70DRAFT_897777 [Cristinia sonorae]